MRLKRFMNTQLQFTMPSKPLVIFRADSSKDIGMGHITRDSDLADALHGRFGAEILFITRDTSSSLEMLRARGFSVVSFPSDFTNTQEHRFVLEVVAVKKPALFILDMLDAYRDLPFLASLKKHAVMLGCIADNADFFDILPADFVVNGNPCQLRHSYKVRDKYLLGPQYFILAPVFLKLHNQQYTVKKKPQRVTITLGGSDHNNLIFKVLGALKDELALFDVTVVVGPAFGKDMELHDFVAREKLQVMVKRNVLLAPLLFASDIVITAGGNTLFERLVLGVPGITINQLPMQQDISACFAADEATINIGMGVDAVPSEILRVFRVLASDSTLRQRMSEKGKSLVDGLGVQRILTYLHARRCF